MAQLVEHILGKDEVISSTLISSSKIPFTYVSGIFAFPLSFFFLFAEFMIKCVAFHLQICYNEAKAVIK